MLKIIDNITDSKLFIFIASLASIVGLPITFMLSGYQKQVVFTVVALLFIMWLYKINKSIGRAANEFNNINENLKKLDLSEIKCNNDCQHGIFRELETMKKENYELLENIAKSEEVLELIHINKNYIIVVAHQNSTKFLKMLLKGNNVSNIGVSTYVEHKFKFANGFIIEKIDHQGDSDIESFYGFNVKQGFNLCIFKLDLNPSDNNKTITIEVIDEDRVIGSLRQISVTF